MVIWGDFQGITGVTRGGRGVNKLENWGDVIYECSFWTATNDATKIFQTFNPSLPLSPINALKITPNHHFSNPLPPPLGNVIHG